ncbi:endonuclease III domain-containing protein [Litorimonas cladophorae]|uniref:endonuclease III domain-containing protein n=1 Tax=Litorimonas cladophorae TaxID=1220491 RepID=UPI001F4635F5|nr:endonuclease III [Litorimonas cladophorae]
MPLSDVEAVLRILSDVMPGDSKSARGPKRAASPFRSCVSCMLSAQSLDRNTAAATKALFKLARSPKGMLKLSDAEIVDAIRPAGLYNMKARNIRRFCEQLLRDYDGVVPATRDELLKLHGIGRKCADLVAHFAFGEAHIAVDTHIRRVCQRTGLAAGKVEAQIAVSLDERAPDWAKPEAHFWLLQFGKRVCKSRTPQCGVCPIRQFCLFPNKSA